MNLKLTKNQSLVLSILFANPGKSFYLRELAKMLNKEPGVFQRDINNLAEEGLLDSAFRGQSRFFKLNKKYPLFSEIQSIVKKTCGLEKMLAEELCKIKNIRKAFIFGSFANNTQDSFSDVDLIIVGSPDQYKLNTILKSIEKKFHREINYTLYSVKEYQNKKTGAFLKSVLISKRIDLIDDQEI